VKKKWLHATGYEVSMFFIKCIVGYIEVEVAACPRIGGFSFFMKCIVGYSEVEVASCQLIGGLNAFYKVYCRI